MGTGIPVGIHTMIICKSGTMPAAIKDSLTPKEGVESVLIGQGMGCGTIRTASERKHGIVGMMPYVGIHQGSTCLFEDFGFR